MAGTHSAAMRFLANLDSDWANLIAHAGRCTLQAQTEREPYEALVRAVAHQQLHGKAAEAILQRLLALFPRKSFPDPQQLLAMSNAALRSCGFSAAKINAIRGIAQGALNGQVPTLAEAQLLDDETLIRQLVELRGVGRWTVEMLLIFSLGRPDVLPVDDFGAREGWRILKSLPQQPKPRALAEIGLNFRPHRSTAAWYLWRASEISKNLTKNNASPVT
ncbi:MAG: DNA-3-methyladenine glycosylase [Methylobacillus sp.]|jgi:DNA-3-methyladenine glycosylase II|nr:DNA-3-methyladenine glycosylase [Methylobacillus sp.]